MDLEIFQLRMGFWLQNLQMTEVGYWTPKDEGEINDHKYLTYVFNTHLFTL